VNFKEMLVAYFRLLYQYSSGSFQCSDRESNHVTAVYRMERITTLQQLLHELSPGSPRPHLGRCKLPLTSCVQEHRSTELHSLTSDQIHNYLTDEPTNQPTNQPTN